MKRHDRAAAVGAVIAGLMLGAAPVTAGSLADEKAPGRDAFAHAVSVAGAEPLSDAELAEARAGFLGPLLGGILTGLSAATEAPLAALPGLLPGAGLPPGVPALNLVQAQINDEPVITRIGVTPQTLTLTGPGYSVELRAGAGASAGIHSSSVATTQTAGATAR